MSTICLDSNDSKTGDKWLNREFARNKRSFSEQTIVNKKLKTDSSDN